jgi:hypothetical protein
MPRGAGDAPLNNALFRSAEPEASIRSYLRRVDPRRRRARDGVLAPDRAPEPAALASACAVARYTSGTRVARAGTLG